MSMRSAPTTIVSASTPASSTSAITVAAILVTSTLAQETGRVRSRSAVPFSSSSAVAPAPQVAPTAMNTRGTTIENSSTLRKPAPVV